MCEKLYYFDFFRFRESVFIKNILFFLEFQYHPDVYNSAATIRCLEGKYEIMKSIHESLLILIFHLSQCDVYRASRFHQIYHNWPDQKYDFRYTVRMASLIVN